MVVGFGGRDGADAGAGPGACAEVGSGVVMACDEWVLVSDVIEKLLRS